MNRDDLGRVVREAWVRWALTQTNPKPSWLVPWEGLAETDREADRQIGEAVAERVSIIDAAALIATDAIDDQLRETTAALAAERELADDLANCLAQFPWGWRSNNGHSLANYERAEAMIERYRAARQGGAS